MKLDSGMPASPIVLIVDDEPSNIQMLAQTLGDAYQIMVATDGATALEIMARAPVPDIVLLDILMPGMDGFEVCRRIKADRRTASVPVVFVTAVDDVESERRGFEVGAVDFLTKPVNPLIARARVQSHLYVQLLQRRLLHFFGLSPTLFCIADRNGRLLQVNEAWENQLGYVPDEVRGAELLGLVHSEDREHTRTSLIATLQRGGVVSEFVHRLRDARGGWHWLEWHASVEGDSVYAAALDITAKVERERYLHLTKFMTDHAAIGIFWVDADGHFRYVNKFACDFLGYTQQELLQMSVPELDPDFSEEKWAQHWQELKSGKSSQIETRQRAKNGEIRQVEVVSNYIKYGEVEYNIAFVRDISGRKRIERDLEESRASLSREQRMLRTILDHAPIGIWMLGVDGSLKFVNSAFSRAMGVSESQFMSARHYSEILPDFVAQSCMASDRECLAQDSPHVSHEWLPFADGQRHLLEITKVRLFDESGKLSGLVALSADVTSRKLAEDRLLLQAKVFENAREGILITDADMKIVEVNRSFADITGYSRDEMIGETPAKLKSGRHDASFYEAMWSQIKETGYWSGEIWNRRKSGEVYPELLTISRSVGTDGHVLNYLAIFSDISERKQHEAQLERIAHYDALTGIPNRVLLADRMRQALAQSKRDGRMLAVCYLDLDGFKPINDSMGHATGDRILVEVAKRLSAAVRGGDTAARLGGDEFVLLLLGLERMDECVATLERLLEVISAPILVGGRHFSLSGSIGVSLYPGDDDDADTLLRHADQAMYVAKQSGKNRFHLYDAASDQKARSNMELQRKIRAGLEAGEFELYFQPKVEMRSGRLTGVEALIRWRRQDGGLVMPAEFLHTIEGSEIEIELGDWVIDTALGHLEAFQLAGLHVQMSVNVSAHHLLSRGFVEKLSGSLQRHPGLATGCLQVEVLETAALDDIQAVSGIIEQCRQLGVGFALDDFGTGYSSLSYLRNLPVDVLKIDQSFVRDMQQDTGDKAIVQGIIALAGAFGLETVAEGVETEALYCELSRLGCDLGQGFGIARPMTANQLLDWCASDPQYGSPINRPGKG